MEKNVMSSLEADIKKQILGRWIFITLMNLLFYFCCVAVFRSKAEKVFRPWWDTLEDYLLNSLVLLGEHLQYAWSIQNSKVPKFKFPLGLSVKFNVSVPQPNPQLKTYEDVNMYLHCGTNTRITWYPSKMSSFWLIFHSFLQIFFRELCSQSSKIL